jgi:hypothetical protein
MAGQGENSRYAPVGKTITAPHAKTHDQHRPFAAAFSIDPPLDGSQSKEEKLRLSIAPFVAGL